MLEVRLLGNFEIKRGKKTVSIPSRPAQSLFAFLILNAGKAYRREKLAGQLWPDTTEESARDYLRHALWRIRTALQASSAGTYLQADDLTIAFNGSSDYWLDAAALRDAKETGPIDQLAQALSGYAGELLPGFYDEWAVLEREHLQAVYERKVGCLLDLLNRASRWSEVLEWAEKWIASGQKPESAYRHLMSAYAAQGDMAKAAAAYERCVKSLAEFGVEPSERTRRFYEDIRTGKGSMHAPPQATQAAQAATTSRNVPNPLTSFIGREHETNEIVQLSEEHKIITPTGSGALRLDKPIVGREQEVETLRHALHAVQRGTGQCIIISGDAGIGKSRLLTEISQRADAERFLTLQGYCFEQDLSFPYAPLVDALRIYLAQHTPLEIAELLGPIAPEIIKLIPELALSLPHLQPTATLDPEAEKRRLFEALIQFFIRLAATRPLLIILEDLHWSDETSLDFLQLFARRLSAHPILLLASYRPEEAPPHLTHLLAQLDRQRLASEIALAPLTYSNTGVMLRAISDLPYPVRSELLDLLYPLTEGNPFFLEEVLKALIAAGEVFSNEGRWERKPIQDLHIPRSVQDAVQRRTARLGQVEQKVLILAAVAGRRFSFALLQEFTELNAQELLQAIQQLITAQLVVEESVDQFAFRHALTREAVYATLMQRERKELHQRVAETLERISLEPLNAHSADLAYHYYAAEMWTKALEYSRRAGEKAQALYAPHEAIQHFTRALEAAQKISLPLPAEILRARGEAHETAGDFESARTDFERAYSAAREVHDRATEWQGLIDLGSLWAARGYARTGEYFQRALDLAREMADLKLHAHSLNRLGNWLVNIGQPEEGLQMHRQALGIFEAEGDKPGTAETLDLMGMANALYGDMAEARKQSEHAITLFRELQDKRGLVSNIAVLNGDVGLAEPVFWTPRTLDDCEREAAEALNLARQLGWPAGQANTEWTTALALSTFGEFGKGLAHAREALRISVEVGHSQWMAAAYSTLGQIYTVMLQPDEALQALEAGLPLARELGSAYWIGNITSYLAQAYLLKNEPQRAEAALHAVMPRDRAPRNLPERRMAWAWGEVMITLGKPNAALQIANQLIETAPGTDRTQSIPALLKLKGEALVDLRHFDEAERALEEAKRGAQERRALPLQWQINDALAGLYKHVKREDDAEREVVAAREIIQTLEATIYEPALRESFTRAALKRQPKEKPISPGRTLKRNRAG